MGYLEYWDVKFLSCPIFLEVSFGRPGREMLTISYEADSQMYMLLLVTPAEEHYHLLNMEVSADFYQQKDYFMDLIKVSQLAPDSRTLIEVGCFHPVCAAGAEPVPAGPWKDLSLDEAVTATRAAQSIALLGQGGTGKRSSRASRRSTWRGAACMRAARRT